MRRRKDPNETRVGIEAITPNVRVHGTPSFHVEARTVEARRLYTHTVGEPVGSIEGAIVKVIPHPGITAADRVQIVEKMKHHGAAHVWFAPSSAAPKTVTKKTAEPRAAESVREAIAAMVASAHTANRELLASVIETAISTEGL